MANYPSPDSPTNSSDEADFYLSSALEPEAWRFSGGTDSIRTVLDGYGWQIAAAVLLPIAAIAAQGRLRSTPATGGFASWGWAAGLVAAGLTGLAAQRALPHPEAFALLNRQMVGEWNVGFAVRAQEFENLDETLEALYAQHHDQLSAKPRAASGEVELQGESPNIVIVVVDSLRSTMLTPKTMPRLSALASRGVRFDAMFSAGNSTTLGLYGLFNGRSAVHTPTNHFQAHDIEWMSALKRAGYDAWFLQASKMWFRLAPIARSADFQIHNEVDGKSWRRDQRVVRRVRGLLKRETPTLLVALLVSTHQTPSFPSRYWYFVPPTDPAAVERGEVPSGCQFVQFRGRKRADQDRSCTFYVGYYRAARYIDTLIADLVESIDLTKTILLFTADHGQSFGEDGGFFHGSHLSDVQIHVPAILMGPGVPQNRIIDYPTSLSDAMATIFTLLGVPDSRRLVPGRSWFSPIPEEERFVSVVRRANDRGLKHLSFVGREARYLLKIDSRRPKVSFIGEMNSIGKLPKTSSDGGRDRVVDWFRAYVRRERGL